MSGGYCGARCEGREAGVIFEGACWQVGTLSASETREGTRGQVGTVTRGEAKIHGRHAVPPLPGYRVKYCDFILHTSR